MGPAVDLPGEQLGVPGLEQDVVERDALIGDAVLQGKSLQGPTRHSRKWDDCPSIIRNGCRVVSRVPFLVY